jgi:GMP synthase PP-ATPase subunit
MASVGVQAAQCVMKEFPNESIVKEIETDRKKASLAFVNAAEDAERKRRISGKQYIFFTLLKFCRRRTDPFRH